LRIRPSMMDKLGGSAFFHAFFRGHFDVAKLLVNINATVIVRENIDVYPYGLVCHAACNNCKISARELVDAVGRGTTFHRNVVFDLDCLRGEYRWQYSLAFVNFVAFGAAVHFSSHDERSHDERSYDALLKIFGEIPASKQELTKALTSYDNETARCAVRIRIKRKGGKATWNDAQLLAELGDTTLSQDIMNVMYAEMSPSKMPASLVRKIYEFAGWLKPTKKVTKISGAR